MPSLKSVETVASVLFPGVRYKVRTLNVIARAKRDAKIADHRLEYARVSNEQRTLTEKLLGEGSTPFIAALRKELEKLELPDDHPVSLGLAKYCSEEELEAKFNSLPPADQAKIEAVQQAHTLLYQQFILPSTITAALLEIEGFDIDGAPATVEQILEKAPDNMLSEIYQACSNASGLVETDQKN